MTSTTLTQPSRPTQSWYARPSARSWTAVPTQGPSPRDFHAQLPGYAPTRLVEVPALAAELGVDRLFVKDESSRLGLPAFKILGASWAIYRALSEHHGIEPDSFEALRHQLATRVATARAGDRSADCTADRTADQSAVRLVTATDGNHGRAVARMAALLGLAAHVFVPEGVHPAARAAIEAEGATVTDVPGPYDEAVRIASESGGLLVQDTAWPGYERIPQWIVDGYSTLFAEIDDQLRAAGAEPAGLVAVPVGVGSLAQAAITHYRRGQDHADAPTVLAVEPDTAAGVLRSLEHGTPVTVPSGSTIMAGLNCPTPSSLAWPYLVGGLDAAVTVTDQDAADAARELAALGVPAGPCGAASLAGVRAALTSGRPDRRAGLAPHHARTVVLLSTEGAEANPALADA
ncbi:pyridoxal-phosphate dependent enzyme [Actinomadura barringtoniae]|uniref:Pyridoxal-phosphate dependent enzyme n=1 Tax=Actinomadura barringtoniae TaxID=1427535 RepID=A0A939PP43_9ACTN|nr:pyridoxal-phosphate dependent enzyme [Actinomadura barringtoniae]MBO2455563.1 pyridoxal-phosphate dependent enzyme [Actinomadura barringtoniae]